MDMEREDYEEEEEEEESPLPTLLETRADHSDEQSPLDVVAGVLGELAPKEKVAESASETEREPI